MEKEQEKKKQKKNKDGGAEGETAATAGTMPATAQELGPPEARVINIIRFGACYFEVHRF